MYHKSCCTYITYPYIDIYTTLYLEIMVCSTAASPYNWDIRAPNCTLKTGPVLNSIIEEVGGWCSSKLEADTVHGSMAEAIAVFTQPLSEYKKLVMRSAPTRVLCWC